MKTHQREWFARLWKHRHLTRQCCSDSRWIAEPYEHQIRWTWLLVYFTNCWFTGIFKTSQSSRGFKRENEHPCLCCRRRQRLRRLPVLSKQKLKMMTACLLPMGNRLAPSDRLNEIQMGAFRDGSEISAIQLPCEVLWIPWSAARAVITGATADGIWGGGSNFSALHSGAGEPVISYLPLSPLLAAGYNRKGSLPCAILVPLLIIFVLSSNPWH